MTSEIPASPETISGADAAAQAQTKTFDDLGLSEPTLRAVKEGGYNTPTPIQAAAIPEVLKGRDILGIAQTGTGKTASFTLPMIDILAAGRARARMPRTLILEPTRELAAQVAENFDRYGKYQKLTKALLIGGVSFGDQDALLARGVDVLIATPGRLLDHFERGKLLLTGVQVMVVDEADRMLDMGFIPDIERIFKLTPFTRQTLFFSATMPPEITRLTQAFLHNPLRVEVSKPASTASTITQRVVMLPGGDPRTRRASLRAVINASEVKNGIVFCNRKTDVDVVALSLKRHGYDAAPIHGDLDQSQRTKTLDRFRAGDLKILVASDVAARGLDVPDVSHVFNYEPPRTPDDYVHRIGRTGRAGREGASFTLVGPQDKKSLDAIEKLIGKPIEKATIEGLPEAAIGDPRDSGGRGRRAEELKKEHSKRISEKKQRFVKRDADRPTASMEPLEQREAPPRAEREAKPREERQREPRAERRNDAPRQEKRAEQPRRSEERRPPRRDSEGGPSVQGFGDNAPAFLRKK
ncbi:MAG TPA: DEAD/DEAH box helicase [Vitreimonas sp.]|uniref:DEAD/DEAH box helicase n=1 Tax=Vitreimonas sp. TaxID=3069702 RepID=UPI002D3E6558|nr:DEAD/DEAH box helicase [Vitreimonas sp.]HYD87414.1 DEAD/DEAH box helicase [Vitreimonas sp.]